MARKRRILLPPGGVIGVDPGNVSGCIAYVAGHEGMAWPIKKLTSQGIWELLELLSGMATLAVLEKVHAMPKQGVSSTFKFGMNFGELKMALIASRIRFELVTPQRWQASMSCLTKGKKKISRQRAEELFPGVVRVMDQADALLLAEYGRRFLK